MDQQQKIARLTALADALARIEAVVAPVAPRELAPAAGLILATDVITPAPIPAGPRALRDGFAVASDELTDAGAYAPVPLPAHRRIDMGEPMHTGTDAVLPFDLVIERAGKFSAIAPVATGDGVLATGADAAAGAVLRRAGERLRPSDVGVLTAAGIGEIAVRMPRLRLVPARAGQDAMIAGALSLLQSAVANHGVTAERGEIFEETPTDADALIVVGGTGAGRNDAAVRTLAVRGRVELHGIALSPGETAAFGFIGETPVLLLPGRLDAAIAAWLTLGDRLMTVMTAKAADGPPKRAVLGRKHASPLGMAEVVPVGLQDGRASPIASNHWPLQAIVQTDGWFLVPPESEGFPAGAEIMIKPWL